MPNIHGTLERIGKGIRQSDLYQRAKISWIYEFYWTIVNREIIDDRKKELEFYRATLKGFRPGDVIFDVGANIGYKSDIFLRLGARVVAAEPEESCQKVLKQKFLRYRLRKKPFVLVNKAIADGPSKQKMWIDEPGSGKNTLSLKWAESLRADDTRFGHSLEFASSVEVETISLEQLIAEYDLPFYIKIDVEGCEVNVLSGLRRAVPYLSFEINLPEFEQEGQECVRILERICSRSAFNYTPDCRTGMALSRWVNGKEFMPVLASCPNSSIEVFCKVPAARSS